MYQWKEDLLSHRKLRRRHANQLHVPCAGTDPHGRPFPHFLRPIKIVKVHPTFVAESLKTPSRNPHQISHLIAIQTTISEALRWNSKFQIPIFKFHVQWKLWKLWKWREEVVCDRLCYNFLKLFILKRFASIIYMTHYLIYSCSLASLHM